VNEIHLFPFQVFVYYYTTVIKNASYFSLKSVGKIFGSNEIIITDEVHNFLIIYFPLVIIR